MEKKGGGGEGSIGAKQKQNKHAFVKQIMTVNQFLMFTHIVFAALLMD